MHTLHIHLPSCVPHLANVETLKMQEIHWRNEELIQLCVFIWKSLFVWQIMMTDKECGRGSGGEHTGIVIHSLILPVVYFPTVPLSFAVLCFFIPPLQKRHLSLCVYVFVSSNREQHKKSVSFENANRFYLWPAPVREWVSVLREVFVCKYESVCVWETDRHVVTSVYARGVSSLSFTHLLNTCLYASASLVTATCQYWQQERCLKKVCVCVFMWVTVQMW